MIICYNGSDLLTVRAELWNNSPGFGLYSAGELSFQSRFVQFDPETNCIDLSERGVVRRCLSSVPNHFVGKLWIDNKLVYTNEEHREEMTRVQEREHEERLAQARAILARLGGHQRGLP